MTQRSSHTGKSTREKDYYARQLGLLSYEPTVEDEPVFPASDNIPVSEDFEKTSTLPKVMRRRPQSLTEKISTHLRKNWVIWLAPLIVAILLLFVYDFSNSLGNLQGIVGEIKDTLNSFKAQLQSIESKTHEQDLELQKQGIKMEYMEKDLQNLKKDLSPK